MITPQFHLAQDDEFLYIKIDALLAKISDTEIFVDDDEFCFYSTPYYLRLHLPGSIVEDNQSSCTYEEGKFSLKFTKKNYAEFFQGLEMITSLLTPKGEKTAKLPLIEVISKEDNSDNGNTSQDEEFSWYVKRDAFKCPRASKIDFNEGYGFANKRLRVFENLNDEFASVIDIKNPDIYCTKMRMEQKYDFESKKFDADHFIADFIDADKKICNICDYVSPWVKLWHESQEKGISPESLTELTPDEQYKLTILPKKEFLIDDSAILTTVYLGLVDILFAYCYDVRVNEGEKNIESGWNIAKLSSVMSCLVAFIDLKEVVISCFRRCLCYPLYRSWKLNMLVLSDLTILFKAGRLQILKCLLAIKEILQKYELNHILNDLYILDYCVWIQTADVKLLESLGDELSKIVIKNIDCNLDLSCWEDIAIGELEDSDDVRIISSMSQLKIKKGKKGKNHRGEEVMYEDSSSSSSSYDSDDDSSSGSSSSTSSTSSSDSGGSSNSEDDETEEGSNSSCVEEEQVEKRKEKAAEVQEEKGKEEEVQEEKVEMEVQEEVEQEEKKKEEVEQEEKREEEVEQEEEKSEEFADEAKKEEENLAEAGE